ncbi:plastid division protein CDP1, chloroplastic isoform X2 [Rhodamnia argentea]|uniref:Plastid division protein CDP1, chloroplastic isoform X2 n=1 Tax=Rhodamnia argentea TaxID=178133 RepID=A0A8B8Q2D0_9MYRT|nr:plastid division protein CDP1, chloroplastic isoform X2 [Rhodamnia argentea]
MALARVAADVSTSSCVCGQGDPNRIASLSLLRFAQAATVSRIGVRGVVSGPRPMERAVGVRAWRLKAAETARILENPTSRNAVDIPVTCYQLLGLPDQAEKDEIVKSVMQLKRAEVEEGYTMDAVKSREALLMDVRDKLLFEPEYSGNKRGKVLPKSSLRIPWSWLPGALCLLQEVGEEKLVLNIGQAALQHPDAKPHVHDLLLSMALAECAIAKICFEKNKVSQGFEALARAQCLLRSKISLGKMPLLSQIEESLEELAPACTLELLGMPHSSENAERRRGALAALRELLRQGLDVETTCRVQDWPCFLDQALSRLMATEIIELLPWDDLAMTRKNKKSLESQNQRVIVDFDCFYVVLIAHIALGFSAKQMELINGAKVICECLIASEGIDLKFEEAFCLFLLGQGSEAEVVQRLHQLEINSNSTTQRSLTRKEIKDVSGASPSLEQWLKDAVLTLFADTQDCSPSLGHFFSGEKRSAQKKSKRAVETMSSVNHRPLSTSLATNRREFDESLPTSSSSRHLGLAVKQLTDIQSSDMVGQNSSGSNISSPSVQMKRRLGVHHGSILDMMCSEKNIIGRIVFVTVLGCFMFITLRPLSKSVIRMTNGSRWISTSIVDRDVGSTDCSAHLEGNGITNRVDKLLTVVKKQFESFSGSKSASNSFLAAGLFSSTAGVHRSAMQLEDAESLVKQWQTIKAEALGPDHQVQFLPEILDESMLVQWQALADKAKARSCYWRFVLLQLSVLRAEILSDGMGVEMAEIDALLEEAAELVDESQPKNPNYYSSYKIHYVLKKQEDGSWKFCKGEVQAPS